MPPPAPIRATATAAHRLPSRIRGGRRRLGALEGRLDWAAVVRTARPWVEAVREQPAPFWAMESLLREYPISSAEGLALMRLAEALLRVPDAETAIALTADQLGRADFDDAAPTATLAGLSAAAIALSKNSCRTPTRRPACSRLGAKTVVAATVRAIQLLGRQFVLGQTIDEAMDEADSARRKARAQLRFSYDMLGEGARTEPTRSATSPPTRTRSGDLRAARAAARPRADDGISIKLCALFRATRTRSASASSPSCCRACGRCASAPRRQPQPDRSTPRRPTASSSRSTCWRRSPPASRAAPEVERLRPGRAGLPDAARSVIDARRRHRAPARPALHGAPREGRVLGRRDQARAGARPAGLSGVHAQGAHRHLLPRVRAGPDRPRRT